MEDMTIYEEPMTRKEILAKRDEDGFVEGVVPVSLSDAIDNDLEGFLDLISEKLVGSASLLDISYASVGSRGTEILVSVTGDVTDVLSYLDEYEEDEEDEEGEE